MTASTESLKGVMQAERSLVKNLKLKISVNLFEKEPALASA